MEMLDRDLIGALLAISLDVTSTFPRDLRRSLHEDLG